MWDLIVSVPDHCLSFYFSMLQCIRHFRLTVESLYFPYVVHDICIYGGNIDIFSGMIVLYH